MKILAFQGLRYDQQASPSAQAAPPFDQIDEKLRRKLHAVSPHHFSRLTRPDPDASDQHALAHRLHSEWLEEHIIARDLEPSLYPYRIETGRGGERRGVFALVGIGPSSDGDLRPHEKTVDKPLADRLALLEATRVDLEPVMLMAEDPDGAFEAMLQEDCQGHELVRYLDPATNDQHVLYRITDRERIGAYQRLLAKRQAVIADGHHRTKVAQLYARKHDCEEGTAASAKMAVLMSLASDDVVIDPIHRALNVEVDRASMASKATRRIPFTGRTGRELAAAVAAHETPAIGVRFKGTAGESDAEIWLLDPEDVPGGTPGAAAHLPAILLQYQVLAAAGMTLANASDGSLAYVSDPDELWQMVSLGEAEAGFWLPPMTPQAFALATKDGDVMPPKSTRFLPKLASGLVWSGHDGETLGPS